MGALCSRADTKRGAVRVALKDSLPGLRRRVRIEQKLSSLRIPRQAQTAALHYGLLPMGGSELCFAAARQRHPLLVQVGAPYQLCAVVFDQCACALHAL